MDVLREFKKSNKSFYNQNMVLKILGNDWDSDKFIVDLVENVFTIKHVYVKLDNKMCFINR